MMSLTCHVCHSEALVDSLATAERAGWSRSVGGWICESYDCYMSCDHQRLGLHPSAAGAGTAAEATGVC